jgi:outer membrane protein assembly factor BamB
VFVAGMFVASTPASADPTPANAPAGSATAYQQDSLHDGNAPDDLPMPLGKLWSRDLGGQVSYPLMVRGRAFVTTSHPNVRGGAELWALNARTGATLWGPIDLGGGSTFSGITADDVNVYALNHDGVLRAVDEATGTTAWSRLLPNEWDFSSAPTVRNGVVYAGGSGSGGLLYAVDAATGTLLWNQGVVNGDDSSPAVTDDGVYVSYACELTDRFDPTSGVRLWHHDIGCSGGGGRTPVVHEDRVYVRDPGFGPAVLSTATGTQVGAFTSDTTPAFSGSRMFTVPGGAVRALDVDTGQVVWTAAPPESVVSAPLVIGSSVVVGGADGTVRAYDVNDGALRWTGSAGAHIIPSDSFGSLTLEGMAESAGVLLVPATNLLVAYAPQLDVAPTSLRFGHTRAHTTTAAKTVTITNPGPNDVSLSAALTGAGANEFHQTGTCATTGESTVLHSGDSCTVTLAFAPTRYGAAQPSLVISSDAGGSPTTVPVTGSGTEGYYVGGAHGQVHAFGDAVLHGDASHLRLGAPIVSVTTTPSGNGYWLLGRDGGIFAFGDAHFYGSTGNLTLHSPIVGMAATPTGHGYWLVAADGGVFAFGDAHFFGSTGNFHLTHAIAALAPTATGHGYWLVTGVGHAYAFGDAHSYGSATVSATHPVVAITATPTGHGYWLLTNDGHLWRFGDATSHGTATGAATIAMTASPDARGYWEADTTGHVHAFGDAHAFGGVAHGVDTIGIAPTVHAA